MSEAIDRAKEIAKNVLAALQARDLLTRTYREQVSGAVEEALRELLKVVGY